MLPTHTAVVTRVLERRQTELRRLERDLSKLEMVKKPFPRITYDEAVRMLNEKGQTFEWGGDFGAPDETLFPKPVEMRGDGPVDLPPHAPPDPAGAP